MKVKWMIILLFSATALLNAAADGNSLTEEKCASCHMTSSSTKLKQETISAPPMWGVMKKVKNRFKTKEEGVAFITDYAINPAEEKMLFPAAAKERFGLMPSMQGVLTEDELKIIAEFLYR
jgi:hypothetical protein